MRLLFTFIGGSGHFEPLRPVASAAVAAGHDVAVACAGSLVPQVQAAGFDALPTSSTAPRTATPRDLSPLVVDDRRAAEMEFAENFADKGARRHADAVREHLRAWRPDVVVRDEADFGSAIAAEVVGIPVATVLVLASGLLIRPELVDPRLRAIRAEQGLPPEPPDAGAVLSPFPPGFRSPKAPVRLPDRVVHFRADGPVRPSDRHVRPGVYATLGTAFNSTSGDLFERLLAGLADVGADVVLTVGRDLDPADLGPQPAHVRVERFVPQAEVLRASDVVVSHGGSGSLSATLAHGLPSVLLPLGADQPHNAARAEELGLARVLDAGTVTADGIGEAVREVLADASMRSRTAAVADRITALPGAEVALEACEALARA